MSHRLGKIHYKGQWVLYLAANYSFPFKMEGEKFIYFKVNEEKVVTFRFEMPKSLNDFNKMLCKF